MPLNTIQRENQLPGDADWQLSRPVTPADRERDQFRADYRSAVEGYASRASVVAGETITFHVSSKFPTVSGAIFRMGWYAGLGARKVQTLLPAPAQWQDMPATRAGACGWTTTWSVQTPADWTSGVYLLKLTGSGEYTDTTTPPFFKDAPADPGRESYIIFIVRAALPGPGLVMQLSTANWQVYNQWGGSSTYEGNPSPVGTVSFDRPYQPGRDPAQRYGAGAGQFLTHGWTKRAGYTFGSSGLSNGCFGGWEYNMVRWLEREGYDVSYCASHDLETMDLRRTACFLSVGHDEYWSGVAVDKLMTALQRGTSAAFFSGNSVYRNIEFQDHGNARARVITNISFMNTATSGALLGTTDWKAPVGDEQIDLLLTLNPACPPWLLVGTNLSPGDALGYLGAHEVAFQCFDEVPSHMTPVIQIENPNPAWWSADATLGDWRPGQPDQPATLAAGCFAARGSARLGAGAVFNAGSCMWSWALDGYMVPGDDEPERAVSAHPQLRAAYLSMDVQQITRNALRHLMSPGSRLLALDVAQAATLPEANRSEPWDVPPGWPATTIFVPGKFTQTAHDEVLLYDAPRGVAQLHRGGDSSGLVPVGAPRSGWRTTWQIVPLAVEGSPNTHFLCYDPTLGEAQVYRWTAAGEVGVGPLMTGLSKTLQIVPGRFVDAASSQLLFYDPAAGFATVYAFDAGSPDGLQPLGPMRIGWRTTWQIVPLQIPSLATTCFLLYDPPLGQAMVCRWDTTIGEVAMTALLTAWRTTWTIVPAASNDGAVLFHDSASGELYCFKFSSAQGTVQMQNGWGSTSGPATLGGAPIVYHPAQIVPVDFAGADREFFFFLP